MNLQLENKRVLVTGSTGGIGEGIARKFAEEGAIVVINGRRAEVAEQVATSIRAAGGSAVIAVGDLSTDEGAEKVLATIEAELGGVDILVNNAAGGGHTNEMEAPTADWLDSYNTNVLSMVRLIQKLLASHAGPRLGTHHQHLKWCGYETFSGYGDLLHHQGSHQQSHRNTRARHENRWCDHQYG